jgi:hypothetical protein
MNIYTYPACGFHTTVRGGDYKRERITGVPYNSASYTPCFTGGIDL